MFGEKRPGFDYFVTHKGQGKYWDTEFNVDGERQVRKGYYTHVVTDLAEKWIRKSADGGNKSGMELHIGERVFCGIDPQDVVIVPDK